MQQKKKVSRKYYWLLFFITTIHLLSVFMCAWTDKCNHDPNGSFVNFLKLSYWAWFFIWFSAFASLVTILWAVYKLVSKNKQTYGRQFFDVVITTCNMISGVIYVCGVALYQLNGPKWVHIPEKNEKLVNFGFFRLTVSQSWWVYNVFWHIIAPGLVFYFFYKFSKTYLLIIKIKKSLLYSLILPTLFYFYVVFRPFIDKNSYHFVGKKEVYDYPWDYPFPWFYRCADKPSHKEDLYKNTFISQTFWIFFLFVFWFFIFGSLSYFLIKWKAKKSAPIVQRTERLTSDQKVGGSNPPRRTNY